MYYTSHCDSQCTIVHLSYILWPQGMPAHSKIHPIAPFLLLGGGLSGCVKSKPLGNGQIISIDVLVVAMIILLDYWIIGTLEPQLQKVFLPPGTNFLRRNFPNIEEEFS